VVLRHPTSIGEPFGTGIEPIAPPIAQQIDSQDDPHEHPPGEKRKAINYAVDANLIRRTILGGRADLFG